MSIQIASGRIMMLAQIHSPLSTVITVSQMGAKPVDAPVCLQQLEALSRPDRDDEEDLSFKTPTMATETSPRDDSAGAQRYTFRRRRR